MGQGIGMGHMLRLARALSVQRFVSAAIGYGEEYRNMRQPPMSSAQGASSSAGQWFAQGSRARGCVAPSYWNGGRTCMWVAIENYAGWGRERVACGALRTRDTERSAARGRCGVTGSLRVVACQVSGDLTIALE